MLVVLAGGQPKRPSRLARSAPETFLGNFVLPKGAVPTGAQQASTSSRTKYNRITFGAFPSSKWQFTASRTCCRRVSNVSASVKIDSPKARAVKPPSTASSIRKMISFMFYSSKRLKTLRDSPLIRKNALGKPHCLPCLPRQSLTKAGRAGSIQFGGELLEFQ